MLDKYQSKRELWTQIATISVVIFIFIYNHFLYDPVAEVAIIKTDLNELEDKTLDTMNEMTNLLISLSVTLFAMIGYFIIEWYKVGKKLNLDFRINIILAFSTIAISMDFGYIFMDKLVELLSNGIFDPFDEMIRFPHKMQIITFLISVFFTGRLFYKNINS